MHDMVLKLDTLGRPAWIGFMVLSFIIFWPLGLAVLAFLLWSGRMGHGWGHGWGCSSHQDRRARWQRFTDTFEHRARDGAGFRGGNASSGNRAFDEYREETLKRLEDEQREFREFLERLRLAKDRSEFDQFISERRTRPAEPPAGESPAPQS